jgi:hypothetical protein
VSLHINFLRSVANRWRKQTALSTFEFDEILSVCYIEAEHLLRTKYDPGKTTVTTFLNAYLWGRVEYTLLRGTGMRKREDGWKTYQELAPPPPPPTSTPNETVELEDLIENLPINLQEVARRLSQGQSLEFILTGLELPSFDSCSDQPSLFDPWVEQVRELLSEAITRQLND